MINWFRLAPYGLAIALVVGALADVHRRFAAVRGRAVAAEQALQEYQVAAAAVITERLAANAESEKRQATKSKELQSATEKRIADVRLRYIAELERLRAVAEGETAPGGDGALPSHSAAAGANASAAAEQRFVEALRGCEEDREKLAALQAWARGATSY
jgi:hypothetical protein